MPSAPAEQFMRDGQIVILRSTVFPGISKHTQGFLNDLGLKINVAFCPERCRRVTASASFASCRRSSAPSMPSALRQVKELSR